MIVEPLIQPYRVSALLNTDKHRVNNDVKLRPVTNRSLQSDLIQACAAIGKENLSHCHISNTLLLRQMTEDAVNLLKSEYPVPFGAYADVQSMIERCDRVFAEALIKTDSTSEINKELNKLHKTFREDVKIARKEMLQTASYALSKATKYRKVRSSAMLLACPPLGFLGLHHFYLGHHGLGLFSVLTCWTLVIPLFNMVFFLQLILTDEDHFDLQYNPDYLYFKSLCASV